MIDKPKKERRFLKTLGKIGEILLQEVLIKIGSSLIKRIGGKKTLPSILFLFLSVCVFAQYPATGNKQRLGYQTTGDGLVFRGRASDTVAIKSIGLNNAYFILDTVNNILYNYIKTKGGWKFSNGDTIIINNTIDTTSLSNRINLKVNISDTASMLLKYLRKADTSLLNLNTRFAAKLNLLDTASMLTNYLRSGVAASTYVSGSGTTNYIPKFTGSKILGNSLINDNGNYIGINKSIPNVGIDLVNDISAQSAKLRLQTNFAGAQRTLELGSGDGLSWDLPGGTSQSPYIKVIGGDISSGGGGLNLMTDDNSRLFIRKNGTIGIGTITPDATFEVHGSAVFNEGSTDSDFRVESDGNVNMVFVDASTDRVGIGTNAPTKTLEVNGTFNATGDITEGGLNVLTSSDTASLSSRIDAINSGGNQISANNNTTQTISNLTGISNYYLGITSNSTITITLPSVSINVNKMITIKNTGTGAVNSSSSNVQPLKDPIPPNTLVNTSEILISGGGKWTTIVSNGYEWVKMAGN